MPTFSHRLGVLGIAAALLCVPSGFRAAANDHHRAEAPALTLQPGESGTIEVPVADDPTTGVVKLIVEATNSQSPGNDPDSAGTLASSSCGGRTSGVGYGGTIYYWESVQFYSFTGATVTLTGNAATYGAYYTWSYDHQIYTDTGNGTAVAVSSSTGYFRNSLSGARDAATVRFSIHANGTCSVTGSIKAW